MLGVERAHQSIPAATRALSTEIRARTEKTHPSSGCYGVQRGHTIDSSLKVIEAELLAKLERARATKVLSPFMEVCMIRVPTDPLGYIRGNLMCADEGNLGW